MNRERIGPLLLLDGMSLAFRAFFALPATLRPQRAWSPTPSTGSSPCWCTSYANSRPSALVVAFDAPGATFRDEILEDYKAGRAATPDLLSPQFDMIRDVLASLAVPLIETPGYEADDVIATLATEAAERKTETVIVTGDRDSFQLIARPLHPGPLQQTGGDRLLVLRRGGDLRAVRRATLPVRLVGGVARRSLRQFAGHTRRGGEDRCQVPRRPTATSMGFTGMSSELTPKLRENLTYNEPLARSNARIIPLVTDVPLDVDVADLTLGGWDLATAEATFTSYEMKTVWQRLEELMAAGFLGEPAEGSARPGGAAAVAVGARFGASGAGAPGDAADDALPGRLRRGRRADDRSRGRQGPRCARKGAQGAGRPLDGEPGPQRARRSGAGGGRGRARGRRRLRPRRGPADSSSVAKKLNSVMSQPVVGHHGQGGHALAAAAGHRLDRR